MGGRSSDNRRPSNLRDKYQINLQFTNSHLISDELPIYSIIFSSPQSHSLQWYFDSLILIKFQLILVYDRFPSVCPACDSCKYPLITIYACKSIKMLLFSLHFVLTNFFTKHLFIISAQIKWKAVPICIHYDGEFWHAPLNDFFSDGEVNWEGLDGKFDFNIIQTSTGNS